MTQVYTNQFFGNIRTILLRDIESSAQTMHNNGVYIGWSILKGIYLSIWKSGVLKRAVQYNATHLQVMEVIKCNEYTTTRKS